MDRRNTSQSESTRTGTIATVELPATLLERVEARVPRSEFDTTEEYVAFVLEEVLARVEDETDGGGDYDAVDQDEVETRLKSLGYLD
ncbi:hypothetical protein [Natrialbaceae archaeon AArc-T1-2]|uniref:hypothetical protein n=1 Tax=Natrialbaceae archaeon AArc-T1-2 TaxID=3053904 RepID=UPI00255AD5AF|nr:hypothetical protein [Natrialbaceae archaeon AArc-T1-2]WIV66822.1 hypothetical protein QQ977_14175 [Natrialbaceae archaeon AArc-T1-2]